MSEKKTRRQFSAEFKRYAVRIVLEQGVPVARAARNLRVTESVLARWVARARDQGEDAVTAGALTTEQQELRRLRRENQLLKQERETLIRAAALFAKESI